MKSLGQFFKIQLSMGLWDTLYRPWCVINVGVQQHQSASPQEGHSAITYPGQHRWDCLDIDDVFNDYQS